MKKQTSYSILFALFIGCLGQPFYAQHTTSSGGIKVKIDVNVETIGVILGLSDLGDYVIDNFNGSDYSFVKFYREKFKEFRTHPAVLEANNLGKLDLLQFGHYYYGLSFSPLPEFAMKYPRFNEFYSSDSLSQAQMDSVYKQWDVQIRAFYQEAHIADFFKDNKALYDKIDEEIRDCVPDNIVSVMEQYYGEFQNNYVLCPSPMIFTGFNFGPDLNEGDGKTIYFLTGPSEDVDIDKMSMDQLLNRKSIGFRDETYIADLAIHEFGHSFVRFLDKPSNRELMHILSFLASKQLIENFEKIGEGTSLENIFEEHLVRANEVMIWRSMGEIEIANKKMKNEWEDEGVLYIREFVMALEKYEKDRSTYATLEDFLPVLVTAVEKEIIKN